MECVPSLKALWGASPLPLVNFIREREQREQNHPEPGVREPRHDAVAKKKRGWMIPRG